MRHSTSCTLVFSVVAVLALCINLAGPSAAADSVQARKDIKAMGIEYTEQDFAKAAGNGDMAAVQLFIDAAMDVNSGGGAPLAWRRAEARQRWFSICCPREPSRPPTPCNTRGRVGTKI